MPRKVCVCGCREWFSGPARQQFKNKQHYRQSAQFRAQWSLGVCVGLATLRKRQIETLAGLGPLSPRDVAIYRRGRTNGYSAGRQMGYRRGFAAAIGESDKSA